MDGLIFSGFFELLSACAVDDGDIIFGLLTGFSEAQESTSARRITRRGAVLDLALPGQGHRADNEVRGYASAVSIFPLYRRRRARLGRATLIAGRNFSFACWRRARCGAMAASPRFFASARAVSAWHRRAAPAVSSLGGVARWLIYAAARPRRRPTALPRSASTDRRQPPCLAASSIFGRVNRRPVAYGRRACADHFAAKISRRPCTPTCHGLRHKRRKCRPDRAPHRALSMFASAPDK